jgi:hypothetical protein
MRDERDLRSRTARYRVALHSDFPGPPPAAARPGARGSRTAERAVDPRDRLEVAVAFDSITRYMDHSSRLSLCTLRPARESGRPVRSPSVAGGAAFIDRRSNETRRGFGLVYRVTHHTTREVRRECIGIGWGRTECSKMHCTHNTRGEVHTLEPHHTTCCDWLVRPSSRRTPPTAQDATATPEVLDPYLSLHLCPMPST